jgi:hypothetical protein
MKEQASVYVGFNEIILGTILDGLDGEPFVVLSTEDDNGDLRGAGVGALKGLMNGAVGEGQIE